MADDRMKNDDRQRNMGGANREDQDYGQQSPGKSGQGAGKQPGQHAGGQQSGGQFGGQRDNRNLQDDEDLDTGIAGQKPGDQNRGGQNR